ncbi:MAG: prolyl-tRNA synthetase associated domain-containing protein [Alphaproteobacteria bacterium]|nr:prolyl-tRNA synthetase associated domain-containing protein [Alphaproteobacteria bacterium]
MLCSENNPAEEPLPTTPAQLFALLEMLGIEYSLHHHEPVFTVEESSALDIEIPGVHCRNLFLRDKKKAMFLVVAANETAIDLKKLQPLLNCGRLSFSSAERLWTHLGIRPGSVCPFTALNDPDHQVQIILDAHMMAAPLVNYHPLDNAMTIGLAPADLIRFFAHTGHEPLTLDLTQAAPEPT